MKLLLDQNLSYKLCDLLLDIFPDISHVKMIGLDRESDRKIWQYAKENNYIIISKDTDFLELSMINNFPPKIIWLNTGNSSSKTIEQIIRRNCIKINNFASDNENALLILKSDVN